MLINPHLALYTKTNSRGIKDLNVLKLDHKGPTKNIHKYIYMRMDFHL